MDYEVMMNGTVKMGQHAPDFDAVTTFGDKSLNDYKGKWLILFSHPGDFTPVCTTEMLAFAKLNSEFERRNACLLGLSIDSNASHLAWVLDIYKKTRVKLPFPIIADRSGEIARKYGMMSNAVNNTATVRNVYIIDENGIVRLILVYPMNVGRCIPEILRALDALQIADKENAATPANWLPGEPVIVSMPKNQDEMFERIKEIQKNKNGVSWYLSFK